MMNISISSVFHANTQPCEVYRGRFTVLISMHAKETDQNQINDKQCPGEKARPGEEKVGNLFLHMSMWSRRLVKVEYSQKG